jgi:hypothetical protein
MKKTIYLIVAIVGVVLIGLTGCSKNSVDTSKVQSAFQNSSAPAKGSVDQAVSSVKAGDYAGALASLQKAAADTKLTPEQKSAIQDLINQINSKISETANKAASDVSKKAGDLQKSLQK